MEAFCGKWKTSGKLDNFEAYATALHLNEEQRKTFLKAYTSEFSVSGDVLTNIMTPEGGDPVTVTTKLGEKVKVAMPQMGEVEVCNRLEGNVLITEQEIGGLKQIMRTVLKGDEALVETTCNGVTMSATLIRV